MKHTDEELSRVQKELTDYAYKIGFKNQRRMEPDCISTMYKDQFKFRPSVYNHIGCVIYSDSVAEKRIYTVEEFEDFIKINK